MHIIFAEQPVIPSFLETAWSIRSCVLLRSTSRTSSSAKFFWYRFRGSFVGAGIGTICMHLTLLLVRRRGAQMKPNPALNLAPFGRWTLRDKAVQCRLALRYAS